MVGVTDVGACGAVGAAGLGGAGFTVEVRARTTLGTSEGVSVVVAGSGVSSVAGVSPTSGFGAAFFAGAFFFLAGSSG